MSATDKKINPAKSAAKKKTPAKKKAATAKKAAAKKETTQTAPQPWHRKPIAERTVGSKRVNWRPAVWCFVAATHGRGAVILPCPPSPKKVPGV